MDKYVAQNFKPQSKLLSVIYMNSRFSQVVYLGKGYKGGDGVEGR